MAHPIHLHGKPFEIIERSFEGDEDAYASIRDGFIDSRAEGHCACHPGRAPANHQAVWRFQRIASCSTAISNMRTQA